jgi:hypothetical protein
MVEQCAEAVTVQVPTINVGMQTEASAFESCFVRTNVFSVMVNILVSKTKDEGSNPSARAKK